MTEKNKEVIFKVNNLKTWFPIKKGALKKVVGNVKAVDGVSLEVYKGETLGIVGESGCGKSTFGKTVMMLEKPVDGQVEFNYNGEFKDITKFSKEEMFDFRKKVQMVFQDPYSALNPQKKIYTSFEEPLIVHGIKSKEEREKIMERVLKMVNIQPDYLQRYPHEFSGGQRQRLCIARALEVMPEVLICDEPVSALDVSIQAQVLNLMKDIQKELNLTYMFIAHDLSVVQYMADRIVVMYLGKIVEIADSKTLYEEPLHPYTKALLSAIPVPDIHNKKKRQILDGEVPSPINKPSGCAFHNRCPLCTDRCKEEDPAMHLHGENGHIVACHKYDQKKD
ncbi:oligopeptide transport system ATP-binding protein [Anaerosporobacter mobilis DSM 15930]|jgi:oligopeptide/dipeptide ABC transporter ATP-binding protein|uniref:Oligopeptide transport system ATP-binding protein n=1 Tax=Anaerosporobacter mobilis DSM 15930 TaxID=1120996 RepID=A0A1M7KLS2_9FIRM|nr:dipeptide ABC transporter ATP-binding protein [Anaerosporobacter mobilis]SHM66237.1 oligopeptide transport system ATP-binding protein [Anaerosporobacter mobilis DSM 15930]